MTYAVSEQQPPELVSGAFYWERSLDPFHDDAFKGISAAAGPSAAVLIVIGGKVTGGPRRAGWMAIDYAENPVGFVPDGDEREGEPFSYLIQMGPCGHMCAYPPDDKERIQTHARWIEQKAAKTA